jgi:hypothetical protein
MFTRLAAIAIAFVGAGCASVDPLTEESLLEYASAPYDKAERAFEREVLGVLNEATVVVDYLCSDLCPEYTIRIIRFDVEPGEGCAAAGGVERTVVVPVAITAWPTAFCFPRVLAENWAGYVR